MAIMAEDLIYWVISALRTLQVDSEGWELGEVVHEYYSRGKGIEVDVYGQPEGDSSQKIIADCLLCEHQSWEKQRWINEM